MPRERAVRFNAQDVLAILDRRKSQFRSMVSDAHLRRLGLERDGEFIFTTEGPQWNGEFEGGEVPWCPYGNPGDHLWVQETFRIYDSAVECACYDECSCSQHHGKPVYRAGFDVEAKWKSSTQMPRWASRITLEIVSVRVERLNDISQPDIAKEGIDCHPTARESTQQFYRSQFSNLWESINGPESWSANPFVWVIEFKKLEI